MTVANRSNLMMRSTLQCAGGGKLLKVIYVEEYNHILATTDIIRFA